MIFCVQKLDCLKFRSSSNTLAIEPTHKCFSGGKSGKGYIDTVTGTGRLDGYYNCRCKYTDFDHGRIAGFIVQHRPSCPTLPPQAEL
jgi:hypothetical protein